MKILLLSKALVVGAYQKKAEELAAAATEAQIIELIRCGVMLNDEVDSLSMFVVESR